jgi:hypothetical protein
MKTILISLLLVTFSSSCATTIPVSTALPLPERPALPSIPASEVECLSDDAWNAFVTGRRILLNHIETLENIILGTHK